METLTIIDYLNRPLAELMAHPNFDQETFSAVARISREPASSVVELYRRGCQDVNNELVTELILKESQNED